MSETAEQPGGYVGPDHVGAEILCVEDLSFTYPDGTTALEDVSLHLQRGATLGVIGPNGAGKTSLLKILLGLLEGYSGTVAVAGLDPLVARQRGGIVSWVPQHVGVRWDFPVTVEQVVRMGLVGKTGMLRRHRAEDLAQLERILEMLDLAPIRRRPIGEVSGGQQQRAIIARALAPRPQLLLLDEPTVGIDEAGLRAFSNLLKQIRQSFDVTLVIVSHDLRKILSECERVACLNRRLHFHDLPSRLTPELLGEVFRCELTGVFAPRHTASSPGRDRP
ncbi:MAG TPA: metal ABC transporter ATP-binding protein [Phycisphaerae bacterium]|nr:metal ABC transporter ATP-binding protein [Phycisphaerae bacterium]